MDGFPIVVIQGLWRITARYGREPDGPTTLGKGALLRRTLLRDQ